MERLKYTIIKRRQPPNSSFIDAISLETPQIMDVISPSASALRFLTGDSADVPSTAEIIQKCLTVNPFDLKFREANMQIGSHEQDSPEQPLSGGGESGTGTGSHRDVFSGPPFPGGLNTTTAPSDHHPMSIALPSMLKLSSQSPGIFSNINMLSADFEDELRKTISISRKLRESRDESKCEPRTADVIDGVIDVEFNRSNVSSSLYQHLSGGGGCSTETTVSDASHSLGVKPSSLFSAQDLIHAAATAYGNQLAVSMHNVNISSNQSTASGSLAASCAPSTSHHAQGEDLTKTSTIVGKLADSLSVDTRNTSMHSLSDFQFSAASLKNSPLAHSNLTAAAFLQQQSMVQRISPEKLMALHSSAAAAVAAANSGAPSRHSAATLVVPSAMATTGAQSRSAGISPRSNIGELKKTSSAVDLLNQQHHGVESNSIGSVPSTASDTYDTSAVDVKPIIVGKHLAVLSSQQQSQLQQQTSQNNFYVSDDHMSAFSSETSLTDIHDVSTQAASLTKHKSLKERPRKYTKYSAGTNNNDALVTSTRGGRGRRSTTNEMAPDERRCTILERNKAAAVRYRKRKKKEHDEMLDRVQELEQENNSLQTRNVVLVREIERLTNMLKARDASCVCWASQLCANSAPTGVAGTSHSPAMDFGAAFAQQLHYRPDS